MASASKGLKMIAYVLSGGGALGAMEVGVMNQLNSQGIKPDMILGTSTGAMNAVGYGFNNLDYLNGIWNSISSMSDVFTSRGLLIPFYLLFGNGRGVYSTKPLETKINNAIGNHQPNIATGVCRVSLRTTSAEYVWAGPQAAPGSATPDLMKRATLASASTPIFNDVVDNQFVDGGLRHIAPLGEAINIGADEIYVILCEQFEQNQVPNYTGKIGNVLNVANYVVNTFVQGVLWNDVKICQKINSLIGSSGLGGYKPIKLHVYAPTASIGSSQDFSKTHIQYLLNYGQNLKPII